MKKPGLTLLAILPALAVSLSGQSPYPREGEVGSVAAQFVGRFVIGADGNGEVIGYMPFLDGIGNDLFINTADRGEHTALFSVRSNRIAFARMRNGSFNHFLLGPASDSQIEFKVYFNESPDRNFGNPASFATGQLVGVVRLTRGMLTVTPVSLDYTSHLELIESHDFILKDRTINFRALGRATLCHVMGDTLPAVLSGGTSVPLGGQLVHAGR
ncbi:MAG: hypothetical protein R2729_20930 [Bryobacteraceae bacterium]